MIGVFPSVLKTAKLVSVLKVQFLVTSPLLSNGEKILENNDDIYNLQLGFRQQYSISHILINLSENIRKALDNENIGFRVFVDFKKLLML